MVSLICPEKGNKVPKAMREGRSKMTQNDDFLEIQKIDEKSISRHQIEAKIIKIAGLTPNRLKLMTRIAYLCMLIE